MPPIDCHRVREWIARGESSEVLFKSEVRGPLPDRDLVDAVVCLANGRGGVLLLGVEDDGRVSGAHLRGRAGSVDPRQIEMLIANRTHPTLSCTVTVVDIDELPVVVIQVPSSRNEPE